MNRKKRAEGNTQNRIYTELARANITVVLSYLVCSVIYSAIGFWFFAGDAATGIAWRPAAYYGLLLIPFVLIAIDFRKGLFSEEFRYNIYIPATFFYLYLLLLDKDIVYFIFAVCLIATSVIYYDTHFSQIYGTILCLLHIAVAVFLSLQGNGAGGKRIFYALIVFMLSFFMNHATGMLTNIQKSRMKELHNQKQRFEALVSVDSRTIFEYNLKDDEMVLNRTSSGSISLHRHYENFSKVAKQYRYVLYADWEVFDDFLKKCYSGEEMFDVQMRLRNKKADYLWYQLKAKTLLDENMKPVSVIGTMENIDERKRYELRLQDENMRDPLSKLYKYAYAKQLMAEFLDKQDNSQYAGLLIIDIDNFTTLCEKMGNTFGDGVIQSIASDLDEIFYTSDILGRVEGDEFVVLMKYIRSAEDIDKKIREIQDVVRRTYTEKEMNFTSTVSIGASVYPTDGDNFDELYGKAEKALIYEKGNGKDGYGFYDKDKEGDYAQYDIEVKHKRLEQREKMVRSYQGKESNSLTELAFKLIEESKDTDSAINLLLRQVARKLDLDGICIRRIVGSEHVMAYPYTCSLSDVLPPISAEVTFSDADWEREVARMEESNGLICCRDVSQMPNENYRKVCLYYGIVAFARTAFFEKGKFVGGIDFLDCRKVREWTNEEIQTMYALTNVISSYLLKMKAFEDASETVERLTGYDQITGLYKYEKFLSLAEKYLETAEHGNYAVVYVDFSNFKFINEFYGYEVGDKILREYAESLKRDKSIFIAGSRVFSDNMVSLIHMNLENEEALREALMHAAQKFTDKIKKNYIDSDISLIIGVCTFSVDGMKIPFKSIISNANLARKEAKKPENPNCVVYSAKMGEKLIREVSYANDMESAFQNHEFAVYLQPKVDLKSRSITGAEALIRWIKQDGTMIFPNDFIPVFEKNKTITLLDYFVYDEICKYLAGRMEKGERLISISMNVSRIHLGSIRQMVTYVSGLLKKYNIPPHLLEFELTETVFTEKVDDTVLLMNKLRELGVKVSMDDFGSGYSSLNVLTKLPLDVLKLDKEFLKDFETDSDEKIIIPSIIDMAKKLSLSVVCEGVETKQQVDFLRKVDCDLAQGYYYSRPVPLDVFSKMLDDENFVLNQEINNK